MRECNNCDRKGCIIGDRLGPLPKIYWGAKGPQDHCREKPKKEADYSWKCAMYMALKDFRTPLIFLAMHKNSQGLHDNLQAVGLQIDPAYNRKGYVVTEVW
jgi:hypothetical protein